MREPATGEQFIVAEVTKNWFSETSMDGKPPIGAQFEAIINRNYERGYALKEWKYYTTLCGTDALIETIVAIFERRS